MALKWDQSERSQNFRYKVTAVSVRGLFFKFFPMCGERWQMRCRLILLITEHPIQQGIRKGGGPSFLWRGRTDEDRMAYSRKWDIIECNMILSIPKPHIIASQHLRPSWKQTFFCVFCLFMIFLKFEIFDSVGHSRKPKCCVFALRSSCRITSGQFSPRLLARVKIFIIFYEDCDSKCQWWQKMPQLWKDLTRWWWWRPWGGWEGALLFIDPWGK